MFDAYNGEKSESVGCFVLLDSGCTDRVGKTGQQVSWLPSMEEAAMQLSTYTASLFTISIWQKYETGSRTWGEKGEFASRFVVVNGEGCIDVDLLPFYFRCGV